MVKFTVSIDFEVSRLHIGIIGGGSIGLLIASYARKANLPVTIFTRTIEQQKKLETEGLFLHTQEQQKEHFSVSAKCFAKEHLQNIDFLFIAVKQYDLPAVIAELSKMQKQLPAVAFLQNGMGHLSLIESISSEHIFISIVEHGALKKNDTTVVHTGKGKIIMGEVRRTLTNYYPIIERLSKIGLSITIEENWLYIMKKKLLANACINPLTAIFQVENGQLVKNYYFNQCMKAVFLETVKVLELQDQEELWDYVQHVCQKTSKNRSSMLRDLELKKETEIEAISGYLLSEAAKLKVPLPITKFLYNSIKGLEKGSWDSNE